MTIFTKIINREIAANRVYEDDHTLAFHDVDPQAPVHILVIPKKEVKDFQSCDSETIGYLLYAAQAVAKKLKLDESGYRVVINNGRDAGQEIAHLHLHILGGAKLGHIRHQDRTKRDS
ncbi:MAG: histidine triad nucleotide-binding protein [Helicobacteraceae bacterium]|jgi:histidine triad (HIT) family protein|nr:histidine triad nucleotide-binding protein [Helicobacteraceae bacterium]